MSNDLVLNKGEKIILTYERINSGKKLALTNQRLIRLQLKGWIRSKFYVKEILPINEIEEAYVEEEHFTGMCKMKLRLQDQSEWEYKFSLSDEDSSFNFSLNPESCARLQRAITNNWVNAINRAVQKKYW